MRIKTKEDARACAVETPHGLSFPRGGSLTFNVPGFGFISFGQNESNCGLASGLTFDTGSNRHGYSGGVIDRADLLELRDFLTEYLDGTLERVPATV